MLRGSTFAFLCLTVLLTGGCPLTANSDDFNFNQAAGSALPFIPGSAGGDSGTSGGDADSAFTATDVTPVCEIPPTADAFREEVLRLVNIERAAAGVDPVDHNPVLQEMAEGYACEMIAFDFFDHVNPVTGSTLRSRAEESGYRFQVVGENLAAGQTTPQQVVDDWMDSPSHRANLLDGRFVDLGIGIRSGGEYGLYWVQEFGLPAP